MNKKLLETEQSVLSLMLNLMHQCWIKVLISFNNKNKKKTFM